MTWALVRDDLKARWRSVLALSAGVLVFLLVLTGTFSALGGSSGISQSLGTKNNRFFSAFAGSDGADVFSPQGFLAFGFGHPLFLILTLALCVAMGAGTLAQDVESGRAEILYTAPVSRAKIVLARLTALFCAEAAVLVAGGFGGVIGSRLSPDMASISPWVVVRVLAQYLPLTTFVGSVGLLVSVLSRSRGGALAATSGLVAGAYVVNVIALLWTPIADVRHADPFFYFRPTDAAGSFDWVAAVVLLGVAAILSGFAFAALRRRDLA